MTVLSDLRNAATAAELRFEASLDPAFDNRWDFYRAERDGKSIPADILDAHNAWLAALHQFYVVRDGAKGVLGSRGL